MLRKIDPEHKKGGYKKALGPVATGLDAVGSDPKTAAKLLAEGERLDPANEHGLLEAVLFHRAKKVLSTIRRTDPPERRSAKIGQARKLLTELTTKAKNLQNGQMVWAYLGQLHAADKDYARALTALEKALAADPASKMAAQLRGMISQLKMSTVDERKTQD